MTFSFIGIGGDLYTAINGKLVKYKQTTLDDFKGLKWMNPYLTVHGRAKIWQH